MPGSGFTDAHAEPESQGQLLVDHIGRLRQIPGMRDAVIIFIPESNLAFEGIHQANLLRKAYHEQIDPPQNTIMDDRSSHRIVLMKEDDNRIGVRTNADLKKGMKLALEEMFKARRVRIHSRFMVVHEGSNREEILQQLRDELDNYSAIYTPSKNLYEGPKVRFSGKLGFGYDDLVICLQLNLIMKRRFFQASDRYGKWH